MKRFARDAALLFLALRAGDLVNLAAGITTTPDNTRKPTPLSHFFWGDLSQFSPFFFVVDFFI